VTLSIGAGAYDITVVSANRFLRRFTGDLTKAGADAQVTVAYYEGAQPVLVAGPAVLEGESRLPRRSCSTRWRAATDDTT